MTHIERAKKILQLIEENRQLKVERDDLLRQRDLLRAEVDNLALELQLALSSSGQWILTNGGTP